MRERGNEINQSTEFLLEPLADIHLNSQAQRDLPRGNRFYLYTFAAISIMVLLVAIINYVNLATVRSVQRAKEIGMRKVMGATRPQLVRQFIAESFLFVSVATLAASLLVGFAINFTGIEALLATDLSFNVLDRPELIVALVLLVVVVGLVSGAYPAFYLSSVQPVSALRGAKGSGRTAVIRQGLVFVQFAMSVGVIISALVMASQIRYMQSRPLGFEPENLVIATLRGADTLARIPFIRNDLTLDSRIISVADAPTVPGVNVESWSGQLQSEQGNLQMVNMSLMYINEGYLDTLKIDIVAGRDLSPAIDDPHQGLVNETFVRNMGWTDPVGKQITFPNQPDHIDTIIGVVKDFHFHSLHQEIEPVALFLGFNGWADIENELQRAQATSSLAIRIDGNAGASALAYLQDKFRQYDPAHPFEYRFMTDILAELYLSEQRQVIIIGLIAGLCILISCLGLFGLSAFNTTRRARELSIRRVMGATPGNLVLLLFRNTVGLIVAASVVAAFIAWLALNSWLNNFNYRESVMAHWEYFILSALAAVLIAFLTQTAQSWKTVNSNPSARLRID
jgi:putative ABC transport system permease protein